MKPEAKRQIEQAAIDLGVVLLREEKLKRGDLYLACRNDGPKLLTVLLVNKTFGYVIPLERGEYAFNIDECVKIEEMELIP